MTLHGIDVSSYQGGIAPAAVQADFLIIKTTGGTGYVNPAADTQYQAARKAGKLVGIYHFAHESGCAGSAAAEAAWFLKNSAGYLNGDTLLVLDFEGDNWSDVAWARAWLDAVHAATGVKPVVYLNTNELGHADWSPVYGADYGLWVASYAVTSPTSGYADYAGRPIDVDSPPAVNWGGAAPLIWQFADNAQIPGYSGGLDADIVYGDANTWHAYCRPAGGAPAVHAPAPAPVHAAPAPAPRPAPAPAPHPAPAQCRVTSGDTLSSIGAQFGVSWQQIAQINRIPAPYVIHVDQILNLPGHAAAPAPGVSQCRVTSGDTLSSIGAQFGVSWQQIANINRIPSPYVITPGEILNLR